MISCDFNLLASQPKPRVKVKRRRDANLDGNSEAFAFLLLTIRPLRLELQDVVGLDDIKSPFAILAD